MTRIKFLNTEIDNLTMNEAIESIEYLIENTIGSFVVTPNVDHIVKLESDDEFKKVYDNANLILADGMPLLWISRFKKKPIKEKISGSDIFPEICRLAACKGYKMFLLGAGPGVAEEAAKRLVSKFPDLKVVDTYSPPFGFENKESEIEKIISIINDVKPDILAVGLGAPKQEKFIFNYKDRLNVPLSLAIGASIDFEAGSIKRAPKWMQKAGLEWLYRLLKEPKRMYKRYLIDDLKIIKLMFKY